MAFCRRISCVALDIGGVLIDIDKAPLQNLLRTVSKYDDDFFDDEFVLLQKGMLTPKDFFLSKQQQLKIPAFQLEIAFKKIIKINDSASMIRHLKIPHIFASNINEMHFTYFLEHIEPSVFSLQSSVLSYQINCLKPQDQFFHRLQISFSPDEHMLLFIDDDEKNVSVARQFRITSAWCQKPSQLKTILAAFNII